MPLRLSHLAALALLPLVPILPAEPIPVRHLQGTAHAFLAIRSLEGKLLATGDLIQTMEANRVTAHLVFHFKDGSLDDETTIFTQRRTFHLVSDHHIQRGPSYPNPLDLLIEDSGQLTSRTHDNDGKEKVTQEHMDLPADLANGMQLTLLLNLPTTPPPETRVSFIVPVLGKPRLIHLAVHPEDQQSFSLGGVRHKASSFAVKLELGGLLGFAAPLVGKQPPDCHVLILPGTAPAFIREEGQLFYGGPIWRIEQISPTFPTS